MSPEISGSYTDRISEDIVTAYDSEEDWLRNPSTTRALVHC